MTKAELTSGQSKLLRKLIPDIVQVMNDESPAKKLPQISVTDRHNGAIALLNEAAGWETAVQFLLSLLDTPPSTEEPKDKFVEPET